MTQRFVSAADVARRAGVSRSAVSRAFTPGAQVSEAARKRIQEAAEDLGYRVNRLARTLHQQRSDLVGVVGGNLANPYISAQLEALSAGLQRRGLQCLLLNSGGGGDLAALLDYRVRSVVLLSGAAPDELVRLCARNGARMVLIGRPTPPEGASADLILADSAAGGRFAARRLIAAGCRNVAVVQSASRTSAKEDRANAFCTEMQAAGVPFTRWAEGLHFSMISTQALTRQLAPVLSKEKGLFPFCVSCFCYLLPCEFSRSTFLRSLFDGSSSRQIISSIAQDLPTPEIFGD